MVAERQNVQIEQARTLTISSNIENPGKLRTVCSGILRHIQEYSAIFSHVQAY